MKRVSWGTRLGFYMVAVGSAFGLGNLWRFPYVVGENGGGAFVLAYIFLSFAVGCSLLIGELMLGKTARKGIVLAMGAKGSSPLWGWIGRGVVAVCLIVLSYYAVIAGWVLHFVMQLSSHAMTGQSEDPASILSSLLASGWLQVLLTSVHLLAAMVVVLKGLEEGLEKWVGYIMPVFAVLLIVLIINTLSFPDAGKALRFLFYPDFSGFNWASLNQALGHVFFTLSIGFGSMVTFGSYMRETEHIPTAAIRVTALDTLISLTAGLLIFPVVLSLPHESGGPDVLFRSLPVLFEGLEGGDVFGVAFFVCLYLAALSASIGLLESIVANLMDKHEISRVLACWIAGGAAFLLGVFPALGSSVLRDITLRGHNVLAILDHVLINWCLPLTALMVALYVGYVVPQEAKTKEFVVDAPSTKLFGHWHFVMRYLAPGLIVFALLLQLVGLYFEFRS